MAEAAALALAAQIALALGIQRPIFLSDNQQLVPFCNGSDHTNPPHWEIKRFTLCFINHSSSNNAKIFKVHRKLNTTAHVFPGFQFRDHNFLNAVYLYQCYTCNQLSLSDSTAICNC
jgi:hypothetical protein